MSAASRDAFGRYRDRMAARGFRPSRRLGQNFLLDAGVHRAVLEAAGVRAGDLVLEVGAGLGFLTRELVDRGARVVAVEIDARLAAIVAEDLGEAVDSGALTLVVHDVLVAGGRLAPAVVQALDATPASGRLLVAANLPYAIAGPFLAAALTAPVGPPSAMGLLVQREFADRLAAPAGVRAYGALSATVQMGYVVRLERTVSRSSFRPRPNVDSAILSLRRRADAAGWWALAPGDRDRLRRFVRGLFGTPRKQLRHALARSGSAGSGAPIDAGTARRRPGELAADELYTLWHRRFGCGG